jgi:hypothetical protein
MTRLHVLVVVLTLGPIGAGMALADPLPDPPPQVLPDPSPGATHYFAPSESTAGTADPGRELGRVASARRNDPKCTTLTPCAVPPPSLEHAVTVPSHAPAGDPG